MKLAAKRIVQLYLFVFVMISGLVFMTDVQSRRMEQAFPKAIAHGAIWPVTVIDWIDNPL